MKKRLASIKDFSARNFQKIYKKRLKKLRFYSRFIVIRNKALSFIDRRPLRSFFIALALVVLLIVIGNLLPKPKQEVIVSDITKQVDVYRIGTSPKVTVQAQIKKTGVITITAQTSGVVNFIHVTEGSVIKKGSPLVNIASNYSGGNAATIQRQIAQKQKEQVEVAYPLQKEILQKQKESAQKADDRSDQLRDIMAQANNDTKNLISLNEDILRTIDAQIANPGSLSVDDLKKSRLTYLNSLNSAKSGLRSGEFAAASDKPGAQIDDLTRESALKDLENKEKQLDLNKELTALQYRLAQVNEASFYPSAPFSGTVERVFVKPFDSVAPGTPLMVISQTKEEDPITAIAFVSQDVAQKTSLVEPSIMHFGNKTIEVTPYFVSTEAVQGTLYAIYYPIPDELNSDLINEGFVTIDVPVGTADTSSVVPFIPIDSVYQTRTSAYIFVIENGKAKSKEVNLGQVFGRYVEVESGLESSDQVILNRNVIDGDKVQAN